MTPPPSPVPEKAKPQRPNPPPAGKGLLFHISFQTPGTATSAQGSADIHIFPVGKPAVTPEGEDPGYIPGETFGPPPKGTLLPENFLKRSFRGGNALNLQTEHSTAPGEIQIEADYDFMAFEKGDVSGVFTEADIKALRNNPVRKTFHYDNKVTYVAPKQGNIVNLEVVPHTGSATITGETDSERAKDFGNKVTGSMEVIAIDGHYDKKEGETTKQLQSYTVYYVTGGLDIKQTN
jgi:hypothetical protein